MKSSNIKWFTIILIYLITFNSCSKDEKENEDIDSLSCAIVEPADSIKITQGDTISIEIITSGEVKSTEFIIDGVLKEKSNSNKFMWLSDNAGAGSHVIKVKVEGNNKSEASDSITILITSGFYKDIRDGNTYKWVVIGEQIWMAENLRYLPETTPVLFSSLIEPCYYVNNGVVFYNYNALNNIVPDGWRIPTKEDWEKLIQSAEAYKSPYDDPPPIIVLAAGVFGLIYGIDYYGFHAIAYGYYNAGSADVYPFPFGTWYAIFWSITPYNTNQAYCLKMDGENYSCSTTTFSKINGLNVRLIKN